MGDPRFLQSSLPRIVPALLEVLSFRCNNDVHRPVMDVLALLERYRHHKTTVFPATEKVPLAAW